MFPARRHFCRATRLPDKDNPPEFPLVRMKTDRFGGTTYTFSNFENFLRGNLQAVQYVGDLSDVSPLTGVSGERQAEQEYYIVHRQD